MRSTLQTSADLVPKMAELRERHIATCMGFIADAFAKVPITLI